MANRHRGEVDAVLDGRRYALCLTLGALAELESALGAGDLVGLAERFSTGRLKATDAVRVIGAALRGAGHDIDDAAVARMKVEKGAVGVAAIVAELIAITFGGAAEEEDVSANPTAPPA